MARPKIRRRVDAIALLKSDHRKVEKLFKQFEKSRDKRAKARLAREICMELMVHTTIEEEIFYPAVKDAVDEEIHDEAYVEHDGAKVLIAEISERSPDDEFYDAKVKVLSEMIKHHVKEEEQRDGLFAQAKKEQAGFRGRLAPGCSAQAAAGGENEEIRRAETRDPLDEGCRPEARKTHRLTAALGIPIRCSRRLAFAT